MTRVKDFYNHYRKEVIFSVIIFLVATLSFGLGYLTSREFHYTPIVIEKLSE